MTISFENFHVKVYDFERDGETKYGFAVTFEKVNEVYTPFVTNSRDCISLFVEPIEFAERIQDMGSKYVITPNAIIFEDKASAEIATGAFLKIIAAQPLGNTARLLYNFAKDKSFGKRQKIAEDLAVRCNIPVENISETEIEGELLTLTAIAEDSLVAYHEDKKYEIVSYDIATGILTAKDSTTLDVSECDLTY